MDASDLKLPVESGLPRWSRAAVALLTETASEYNRVLTLNEFADEIQRRAGAWANVTSKTWVRRVLAVVTLKCTEEGWPYLASLVVRPSDGKPGPWYLDVLAQTGPGASGNEVQHAAEQRLACYKFFDAELPADAQVTLDPLRSRRRVHHLDTTARTTRASTSTKSAAPEKTQTRPRAAGERRGEICPTCFMEMPVSGGCPQCS